MTHELKKTALCAACEKAGGKMVDFHGWLLPVQFDSIIAEHKASAWHLADPSQTSEPFSIPITAIREGEVAGIHEIRYDSPLDTITLVHEAKSREGLALGATLAAEFLVGKKGFFTMHDLLQTEP